MLKKPWTDHAPTNLPVVTRTRRRNMLPAPFATEVVDAFAYRNPAYDGWERRLVGFGTFTVSKRAARSGRNPRTGATIKIKAAKVPKFRPGKALKDAVN